jgi:uncharacterized membrane protein YhiD involved in acid resistance
VLSQTAEITVRLAAALVIGSAIGANRDLHGKAAGVRTHALEAGNMNVIETHGRAGDFKEW